MISLEASRVFLWAAINSGSAFILAMSCGAAAHDAALFMLAADFSRLAAISLCSLASSRRPLTSACEALSLLEDMNLAWASHMLATDVAPTASFSGITAMLDNIWPQVGGAPPMAVAGWSAACAGANVTRD